MKTKNRSLFSRMCKCYGKESHAQVQQIEEEPSTVTKVSDEVTLLFVKVIVGGTLVTWIMSCKRRRIKHVRTRYGDLFGYFDFCRFVELWWVSSRSIFVLYASKMRCMVHESIRILVYFYFLSFFDEMLMNNLFYFFNEISWLQCKAYGFYVKQFLFHWDIILRG